MKTGRRFLGVFDSLIDRILCVLGAVLFSQGPEFMQQYLQRLGGHLAEAQRQLASFQAAAAEAGVPLERFISQTGATADPGVARLGGIMSDTVQRVSSLQAAQDTLFHASLWVRPVVFLRHLDLGIGRATWAVYRPAVPTTIEGFIYALTGMLVFLALYHFGLKPLPALFTGRSPPSAKARP